MNEIVTVGETPIFDQLNREMAARGKRYDSLIADGPIDLGAAKKRGIRPEYADEAPTLLDVPYLIPTMDEIRLRLENSQQAVLLPDDGVRVTKPELPVRSVPSAVERVVKELEELEEEISVKSDGGHLEEPEYLIDVSEFEAGRLKYFDSLKSNVKGSIALKRKVPGRVVESFLGKDVQEAATKYRPRLDEYVDGIFADFHVLHPDAVITGVMPKDNHDGSISMVIEAVEPEFIANPEAIEESSKTPTQDGVAMKRKEIRENINLADLEASDVMFGTFVRDLAKKFNEQYPGASTIDMMTEPKFDGTVDVIVSAMVPVSTKQTDNGVDAAEDENKTIIVTTLAEKSEGQPQE